MPISSVFNICCQLSQQLRFHLACVESLMMTLNIECQPGSAFSDFQLDGSPLNERQAVIAAHGQAAADGNLALTKMVRQHLLNALILNVVPDGIKLTQDNALHPV